jgi:hypothetical protein
MNHASRLLAGVALTALPASSASAWEIRARWVERIGNQDVVLQNNQINFNYFGHRVRLQLGVFDNAAGPAPAGGIYGMLDVTYNGPHVLATRTPGRIGPFANALGSNGTPATDPFQYLTNINAALDPVNVTWNCFGGLPVPIPTPTIRGLNTFVSVWEIRLQYTAEIWCGEPQITMSGNGVAASSWAVSGTPVPPTCEPTPIPGTVTYTATTLPPVPFSATLHVHVHPGGPPFPPYMFCAAEWDLNGRLDSADFFRFIQDFFAGVADANCNGVTNSADFFHFLQVFLSDCAP